MGRHRYTPEATPAAVSGLTQVFADATSNRMKMVLPTGAPEAGIAEIIGGLWNASTSQQTGFASDTYLAGSNIKIPSHGLRAGSVYKCEFNMAKTGAGTAAFTVNVRIGTGVVGDTSRVSLAFAVGTANADNGRFTVRVIVRSINASTGTIVADIECSHSLAATGLITTGASGYGEIGPTASSNFDTSAATLAGQVIGISVNGGASFSGTNDMVVASLAAA